MKTRRVTANLPAELLLDAQKASGLGITETLIAGLEAVLRKGALKKVESLRGKITLLPDQGRQK
ncbi:MAG: hypothetical protein ACXWQO_07000 [Bdellovibrionota bacterium]